VHELQEAALLPTLVEHVWDVNFILDEDSIVGAFLKALLGYNGNPSLFEVISYVAYFVIIYVATRLSKSRQVAPVTSA
jgi:high-affinity iron transporter